MQGFWVALFSPGEWFRMSRRITVPSPAGSGFENTDFHSQQNQCENIKSHILSVFIFT